MNHQTQRHQSGEFVWTVDFIEKLFRKKLNIREEIHIKSAHRTHGVSSGHTEHARSIIVRFQSYR